MNSCTMCSTFKNLVVTHSGVPVRSFTRILWHISGHLPKLVLQRKAFAFELYNFLFGLHSTHQKLSQIHGFLCRITA